MSVFKCKMCGGTIEFEQGATVGVCDSCGTKQTLPRLDDDDRKANLYDRANHFRRNNDFDKAMGIYEQILSEDNTDSEAYWSLVLCRYGIEYVEDPSSHKRIPTVNRAQFTSVFDDDNYKSALQYADGYQREIYEEEAKTINEIQKGILAISQKEEPFDVFICYKETDNNGRRTPDSVLANDLYHQLTQEGFKVFFARITLEDKLGTAYEPYIFAALNSAKVMVVLGTKPEYFNAVWVKNEWSRYLALVKQSNGKKTLIPAYRDMDPYDLPEEFSHLQAQDMSKLGFMQDLIRGIRKIVSADVQKQTVKEAVIVEANSAAAAPLLERVFLFLEDGKWNDANIYCEKVLDIDPKNAEAYLGKLMAELQVKTREQLADCKRSFDDRDNFGKVIRFGNEKLESEMRGYIAHINERNENMRLLIIYIRQLRRLLEIYNSAVNAANSSKTESDYRNAAALFKTIANFKDASERAKTCLENAENSRKNTIYLDGNAKMIEGTIASCTYAVKIFESVRGYKDADILIDTCKRKIGEIKAKEEAERLEKERNAEIARKKAERIAKRNKKIAIITTPIVCAIIAFIVVLNTVIIPNGKYNKAVVLMSEGKYEEAIATFESIGGDGYKDSADQIKRCNQLTLTNPQVGDYVWFGSYEQDNDTSNGKEEIEWLVLAKEGNKILVVSKYALDCRQYNTSSTNVTWETCTLRKWLNNDFINAAFSADEKAMIPTVTVSADKNPGYSIYPGNSTSDNIFLLSITEAEKHFSDDDARMCAPTAYAIAQGAWANDNDKTASGETTCWWWLRSPGNNQSSAAAVYSDGAVNRRGLSVYNDRFAVRPALWITISS